MDKKLLIRSTLLSGLLGGVFCILYFLTFYSAGIKLFDPIYKTDFWIPLPFIFISIFYYKKAKQELRFWQGIVLGYVANVLIIVVMSIFLVLFLEVIDPGFLTKSKMASYQLVLDNSALFVKEGMDEESLERLKGSIKNIGVGEILTDKLIFLSIAGFIYSFFLSMILRK